MNEWFLSKANFIKAGYDHGSGRYVLVITQMILATKSFGACRADERSFVCVRSDVDLEIVRLRELALAEAANVLC